VFNPENFRNALSSKTKALILNNAQNPTGKVFTVEEMNQISEILKEFP
jgi:aspartate/methionine/tyrosine aminotransferase